MQTPLLCPLNASSFRPTPGSPESFPDDGIDIEPLTLPKSVYEQEIQNVVDRSAQDLQVCNRARSTSSVSALVHKFIRDMFAKALRAVEVLPTMVRATGAISRQSA